MSEQAPPQNPLSRGTVAGVFLAGYLVRVAVALAPLRWLLQKNFPDDSYMYWQVARNIVAGNGASLDGVNLTTAYHPLWMAPTLLVMRLFDTGGDLPIHVSLLLSGTLDLLTAWLVWKASLRITRDEKVSLLAAALYLFNPYQVGFVLSGLGDGVNALCVLAYCYLYWKLRDEARDENLSWILLGLVAGLAMLARTDSVLFHFLILFHLLLTHPSKNLLERLRRPILVGLASCVIVVPWLAYMYGVTGHFMQSSASSQPVANHYTIRNLPALERAWIMAWSFLRAVLWKVPTAAAWGPLLAGIALLVAGRKTGLSQDARAFLKKWAGLLLLPAAGLLLLCFVHGVIRLSVRQWYLLPAAWLFPLGAALLWKTYGAGVSQNLRRTLWALLVLGFGGTFVRVWVAGYYPWQTDMYDMAKQIREVVPPQEQPRIGGFNILAQAYYNPNQVMNLDGIGNDAVMKDIVAGTLGEYIETAGLKYLLDWDYFIRERYGQFIQTDLGRRLKPLVQCESPGSAWKWKGPLTLYEVLPPGSPPVPQGAKAPIPCKRPGN